jgi:hypothetical protein
MEQPDTHILEFLLKFLFENTEVSQKTINLGISCKTQEGVKGHIISYIHQPDGIYFAWHDGDGLSFFFTKKEFFGRLYNVFIF